MSRADEQQSAVQIGRRLPISPATSAGISWALRRAFDFPAPDAEVNRLLRLLDQVPSTLTVKPINVRRMSNETRPAHGERQQGDREAVE
jgi:hypothetical protein